MMIRYLWQSTNVIVKEYINIAITVRNIILPEKF